MELSSCGWRGRREEHRIVGQEGCDERSGLDEWLAGGKGTTQQGSENTGGTGHVDTVKKSGDKSQAHEKTDSDVRKVIEKD